MRHSAKVLLPLLALAALTGVSRAEGEATGAQTLVKDITDAKAAKEVGKWAENLKRVPGLYAEASEADKKLMMAELGSGLRAKDSTVKESALSAMVETKDGDAVWKAGLKGELPTEKVEIAGDFCIKAIDAVAALHPDGAVPQLMLLVEKAKDPKAAVAAFKALGEYERSKQRVAILEHAITVIKLSMPSSNGQKRSAPSPKWLAMGGEIVPTLNKLTGQTLPSIDGWLEAWDQSKKKPDALFKSPLK